MKKLNFVTILSIASICTAGVTSCTPTETSSDIQSSIAASESTTSEVATSIEDTTIKDSIVFHYSRTDGEYDDWSLWLWEDGQECYNPDGYDFNGTDDFGVFAAYPLDTWTNTTSLNYIFRKNIDGNPWGQQTGDLTLYYADYSMDENGNYNVYTSQNKEESLYDNPEDAVAASLDTCYFDSFNSIAYKSVDEVSKVELSTDGTTIYTNSPNATDGSLDLGSSFELDLGKVYSLKVTFATGTSETYIVPFTYLFGTSEFDDMYEYEGQLGAIYTPTETTFKVWAPSSQEVILNIYDSGTPVSVNSSTGSDAKSTTTMVRKDKGVYEATVTGDLDGKYYTYTITNTLGTNETIDPYARTCGVNGIRGEIVDLDSTDPAGWDDVETVAHPSTELGVYELHVADLTSDSTWTGNEDYRKRFLGLAETGTTYTEGDTTVSTGYDHIKETNVNAVQLQPIYDQANDETNPEFNWGYNAQNFNCLEGSYSSDPYDGKVRMREFKQVVKSYAEDDIEIIMDVVYNHTASIANSSFNYTVPGYYFRYKADMVSASNGSGTGNETASDHSMMRNFMLDSTEFLASEYKLGGYRFDLMGLHDTTTMNEIYDNLTTNVNENITVYGEPWTGGGTTLVDKADKSNITKVPEIGMFNDDFRNYVSGDNNGASGGWVNKSSGGNKAATNSIKNSLMGGYSGYSINKNVKQNIAYVGCHDNATIYDKFYNVDQLRGSNLTDEELADMSVMANGLAFTSQGVSFMQGGDEIMRTKRNEDGSINTNSYNTSYEMNSFKYDQKIKYMDQFNEYANMIKLKTTRPELQYTLKSDCFANVEFNQNDDLSCIYYQASAGEFGVYVIANNAYEETTVEVPGNSYNVAVDTKGVISGSTFSGGSLSIPKNGFIILTID